MSTWFDLISPVFFDLVQYDKERGFVIWKWFGFEEGWHGAKKTWIVKLAKAQLGKLVGELVMELIISKQKVLMYHEDSSEVRWSTSRVCKTQKGPQFSYDHHITSKCRDLIWACVTWAAFLKGVRGMSCFRNAFLSLLHTFLDWTTRLHPSNLLLLHSGHAPSQWVLSQSSTFSRNNGLLMLLVQPRQGDGGGRNVFVGLALLKGRGRRIK